MPVEKSGRSCHWHAVFRQRFLVLLAMANLGCGVSYEPAKSIEGVFQPTEKPSSMPGTWTTPDGSHCVRIEGLRNGWLSFSRTQPVICQPIRVSELGVMTFGEASEFNTGSFEFARLEFSDASIFVYTGFLKTAGRFEYAERPPTLGEWTRHNPFKMVLIVLVGVGVTVGAIARGSRRRRERKWREAEAAAEAARPAAEAAARHARLVAEAAAHRARLDAEASALAKSRAVALARLRQSVADAQGAAGSLPITLGEVEITLDRAQDELESGLYSPFWEALEAATAKLGELERTLSLIDERRTEYRAQAELLGSDTPEFSLGIAVLPDPAATHGRLIALYRRAQSNPHFAMVYEQRRTNAILIAGFNSLGQTIEHLGGRIVTAITGLAASVNCRLASLESSLESAANAAAEQSAALRAGLQRSTDISDAVLGQLRQDADGRAESERMALRMLDNIQRQRKPTSWERPEL